MKKLFCLLFISLNVIRADSADSLLVLENYINEAIRQNTEILSSQFLATASHFDSRINGTLPDPILMIEGRGIPLEMSRFGETRELMLMFEQMFPFPGKLKHRELSGAIIADIQEEMLNALKNEIRQRVKVVFYQIGYLEEALAKNQKHRELMDEFNKIAESKYIVNKSRQQDLYQVKIEIAHLQSERLSLQEQIANKIAALNQLLNKPLKEDRKINVVMDSVFQFDYQKLEKLMEQSNPFLKSAQLRLVLTENEIKVARSNKSPDFKVMGGYMVMNNMENAFMGRIAMTLPFMPWASGDTRAAVEKSILLRNKAEMDYESVRNQFLLRLIETKNALLMLEEQIKLYTSQIIPASEQTVSLSLFGYQADSVDFLSLIQYTRELLKNELYKAELESLYWQKIAQIENIVGITLNEVTQ